MGLMNLLKLAYGLLRDVVGTDIGREVIDSMRPSRPRDVEHPPAVDIETLLGEHRAQVNESLEAVVRKVNEQNAILRETARRQRIWNLSLAGGLILTLAAAIVAMWN